MDTEEINLDLLREVIKLYRGSIVSDDQLRGEGKDEGKFAVRLSVLGKMLISPNFLSERTIDDTFLHDKRPCTQKRLKQCLA